MPLTSPDALATYLARTALIVIAVLTLSLMFFLVVVSGWRHQAAQDRQYDRFRKALALGTAPTGQTTQDPRKPHLLSLGTPVAILRIPSIHVDEVVGEGTTSGVLTSGPGHRRDTPLPGQAGTSVIFGRQAAYGGPFKHIHSLHKGDKIVVITGLPGATRADPSNTATFKVIDVRYVGAPRPPAIDSSHGRLTLVTASGTPFVPSSLVFVDADLISPVMLRPTPAITAASQLMPSEAANATDNSTLWQLVFWLQALVVFAVSLIWSWKRWGRIQTWIVFVPVGLLVAFFVSDQVTRLLPNLL